MAAAGEGRKMAAAGEGRNMAAAGEGRNMAAAGPAARRPETMSRKKYQAALKKEKRRQRRQELARLRDAELPSQQEEEDDAFAEERRLAEERLAEEERQKSHEEWLLREEKAQAEFRAKKEREEAARRRKEEQERKLKAEWEELQRKEREEEEQKQQETREREEAARQMLDRAGKELGAAGPWQNPGPPAGVRVREKDRASCPFYSKTGACRFGERCSRTHSFPASSPTLLVKSMFTTFGMEQCRRDDYDPDSSLEYSDEETYQQFLDFYHDGLPEFGKVGRVIQFKVSCNLEPHLRGNVYGQYQSEEDCQAAFSLFNGRWYAGRQLQCEFCPVTRWKMAICGLLEVQQCPRGKHCNFLHVFRNPSNEFREANRDIHLSPDWPRSSLGKNLERRERTSHHEQHYGGSRRRSLSPDLSYGRNGESDRKSDSSHRGRKSHKHVRKSRERRRSLSRGRRRDHSPGPWSKSRRSRRSRSQSRSSSRSRSHGRRQSGSRDKTTQSPKPK